MRFLADLMSQVRNEGEKICEGGGAKAIENQHAKGRLTARERIELLVDPGTFFELGIYAAHGMYEEWGGAPAAGVITGLARIHTRMVMIIANDATVKAGAFFPMTSKKVIRAQNIAIENRIPTDLSGGFGRRISAAAGRCVSRHGRFRPRVSQQRRDVGDGHSADRGHHGHVRGRRRISAGDVRPRSDDRWQRACFWPVRRWCRRRSGRKFRRKSWAERPCTPASAARWISANRTMRPAWRAFARSSKSGDTGGNLPGTARSRSNRRWPRKKFTAFTIPRRPGPTT